jgi:hypothetical protein
MIKFRASPIALMIGSASSALSTQRAAEGGCATFNLRSERHAR